MRKLIYSVDTLAMVHAVAIGLEGLGLPADAVQFTAPDDPARDDLPDCAALAADAGNRDAPLGDAQQSARYVLTPADTTALSSPVRAELSQGRCILDVRVPDEQLPNVELLFAAFRDDVHRIEPSTATQAARSRHRLRRLQAGGVSRGRSRNRPKREDSSIQLWSTRRPASRACTANRCGSYLQLTSTSSRSPSRKANASPSMRTVWSHRLTRCVSMRRATAFVARTMMEIEQVEIRAQLAIEAAQHVQGELGGHAGGVVVGRFQYLFGFTQVQADQGRTVAAHLAAHLLHQPHRGLVLEIAQRRAGKKITVRRAASRAVAGGAIAVKSSHSGSMSSAGKSWRSRSTELCKALREISIGTYRATSGKWRLRRWAFGDLCYFQACRAPRAFCCHCDILTRSQAS